MADGWQTALGLAVLALAAGCAEDGSPSEPEPILTREQLMDPETCRACHERQYREWSASMHAYAAEDPLFLAMNRRGQEETGGALGDFCVNCHAPMAVREGATTDGLNLDELPRSLKGVTCYFCHNASAVEGTHNNPIRLDDRDPLVMRGGIADPVATVAHRSEFSTLLASTESESSTLCGSCHDIVLPSPPAPPPLDGEPVALERTFSEWQTTLFAPGVSPDAPEGISCGGCHMPPPADVPFGPAAGAANLPSRHLHDHLFPGVDVALDPFPADDPALYELNRRRVEEFLSTTLRVARLCVEYPVDTASRDEIRVHVDLDNVGAGHSWPSGASQDRRAWVELKVYYDEVERYSSGAVADGEDVTALDDPDLWLFRDVTRKASGEPAHMFWDVAQVEPGTIPGPLTNVVGAPGWDRTHAVRNYPRSPSATIPVPFDRDRLRVALRVRIQPVGLDVIDDLIGSGHLDPAVRAKMPTFTLLPNRALATHAALLERAPELSRLSELTFEWSRAVMESGYFVPASRIPLGVTEMLCTGMSR